MRGRPLQALAAITVAGAVLRFATLGVQSYWLDEAATVNLLHKSFGSMLSGVVSGESTPPLYYVFAWLWAKVFGTGEAGLRSFSALLGTATIPLAFVLGRRVGGATAGLISAALCAFNPLLVWYSQEARSYALLVLLSGLTLLSMLDVLERPTGRRLALWAAAAIAALATHYFAGFLIGGEAMWLLYRTDARGRVAYAVGAVVLAAAALLPLALHQRSTGAAKFISASSLLRRLAESPKQFVLGYQGPLEVVLTIVSAFLVAYAVLRLLALAHGPVRHRAFLFGGLGLAAIALPFALAAIGPDYLITRNTLPAWLPLGVAVAVGFATPRARWEGFIAAGLLCLIGLIVVLAVDTDERYQRDDWRSAARALGTSKVRRAVIITPVSGQIPLLLYLKGAKPVPPEGIDVMELDYVGLAPRLPGQAPRPPRPPGPLPLPGFAEIGRKEGETYTVLREQAAAPLHVTPQVGLSPLDSRAATVVYQDPGSH